MGNWGNKYVSFSIYKKKKIKYTTKKKIKIYIGIVGNFNPPFPHFSLILNIIYPPVSHQDRF